MGTHLFVATVLLLLRSVLAMLLDVLMQLPRDLSQLTASAGQARVYSCRVVLFALGLGRAGIAQRVRCDRRVVRGRRSRLQQAAGGAAPGNTLGQSRARSQAYLRRSHTHRQCCTAGIIDSSFGFTGTAQRQTCGRRLAAPLAAPLPS